MIKGNTYTKLERIIVYICHSFKENPMSLGSVKLNKILWFSDAQSLREQNRTITGIYRYTAQTLGPVLPTIPGIMQSLYYKGVVSSMQEDFVEYRQWVYTIMDEQKAQSCIEGLEKDDIKILDHWIDHARKRSVRQIVHEAHDYPWWDKIEIGNPIPVDLTLPREMNTPRAV